MDHSSEDAAESQERLRREVEALRQNQQDLEARLERIENSILFRTLRAIGSAAGTGKKRAGHLLLGSPLHPAYLKLTGADRRPGPYARWAAQRQLNTPPASWFREQAAKWLYRPRVSIVMAVHDPRPEWLAEAIDSVCAQTWTDWELCICDDNSREPWVAQSILDRAAAEPRIRFVRSGQPLGISGAQNKALELATGEYAGFLDHDDYLEPYALDCAVEALQTTRAALLYSDEDHVDEQGRPVRPLFKPDWSPTLLRTCMYFGHFLMVSASALGRTGWFRSEYDGSQDYDLALRVAELGEPVVHIPQVLYHWRESAGSTAKRAAAKPYAEDAGRRALESMIVRDHLNGSVAMGSLPNTYRVRLAGAGPSASLIICTRSPKLIARCLAALARNTSYPEREIIVVHHETGEAAADQAIESIARRFDCRRVSYGGPFNFAEMNNLGAQSATGDLLVFVNDDVRPLAPEWLERMAAHFAATDVGVVGARLLYPGGMMQHAGIATGIMDGAGHPGRRSYRSDYWTWLELSREVSAVTGACLAVPKDLFNRLSGFDPVFPVNYNDVDFCLRARAAGYRVVIEADVLLEHAECATRATGTRSDERLLFHERWAELLKEPDPYYSANFRRDTEEPELDFAALPHF